MHVVKHSDICENLTLAKLCAEQVNLDAKFTPAVFAELDRIDESVRAGAKTFSPAEVDAYIRETANQWRSSNAS